MGFCKKWLEYAAEYREKQPENYLVALRKGAWVANSGCFSPFGHGLPRVLPPPSARKTKIEEKVEEKQMMNMAEQDRTSVKTLYLKMRKVSFFALLLIALTLVCAVFFCATDLPTYAEGDIPEDARARIGFAEENFFVSEANGGTVTLRVYVSEAQSTDTSFTLTETRLKDGGLPGSGEKLFAVSEQYTLPAGAEYIDIFFTQSTVAALGDGVRMSELAITCDTPTVTVGDKYTYGESEPYDKEALFIVYDLDGEAELIIEGFPSRSVEGETGSVTSRVIRSGSAEGEAVLYYRIRDYAADKNELVFENYNSALVFGAAEREKTLILRFFDNDYLNLRDAYKLDIYNTEGVSAIFDVAKRRYVAIDETAEIDFAVEDDEPVSNKYVARAQYYQPGLTDPVFTMNENGSVSLSIIFSGLNGHPLEAFKLFYSISGGTAVYNTDFGISNGNYSQSKNIGYLEVDEAQVRYDQYFGELTLDGTDNDLIDGTRTATIKFFVSGRDDILLQPLSEVRIEITDNEYPPMEDTVGWYFDYGTTFSGTGSFHEEDASLTLGASESGQFLIPVSCSYRGKYPLSIPVRVENGTAKNGADFTTNGVLVRYENNYALYLYINNFEFAGTKSFRLTILEDELTDGLALDGPATLNIIIEGDIEEGYTYIDYSSDQTEDIFHIGVDGGLSFVLKRYETIERITYIYLANWGTNNFTSEHLYGGTFPYEVHWAEGEREKQIDIAFKPDWETPAEGTLKFTNSLGQETAAYKGGQSTSADIFLNRNNSDARYYFSTNGGLTYYYQNVTCLQFEYKYSSETTLRIKVIRDILKEDVVTSVKYRLTYAYYGLPPYIIVSADTAEIGRDINNIGGTLTFAAGQSEADISVTVPSAAGQKGIKYVNIELYDPDAGTYLINDGPLNGPMGNTFSLAKIKINNDVYPRFDFAEGTSANDEDATEILMRAYANKFSDRFGISLAFDANSTSRSYPATLTLYSEYDLSEAGIELCCENADHINAVLLDTPYAVFDDDSVYHTYYYKYSAEVELSVNHPNGYFMFKYTGTPSNIRDTGILLKAKAYADLNTGADFYKFLQLNTAIDSGALSDYTADIPEEEQKIDEADAAGLSYTFTKINAEKDAHIYVELAGSAVYGEDYLIRYGNSIFDEADGYILIPKGTGSLVIRFVPNDNYVINGDVIAIVTFYMLNAGAEANAKTLTLTIEESDYYGDFSVDAENGEKVEVLRENHTTSIFSLHYTITEMIGAYGTDYILTLNGLPLDGIAGELAFAEDADALNLILEALTVYGESAVFFFEIESLGEGFSIQNGPALFSAKRFYAGADGYVWEYSADYDLTDCSNYASYINDYSKYRNFLLGNTDVYLGSAVIEQFVEFIDIDFATEGLSMIYGKRTSLPNKFVVPSGISPRYFDMNGDGRKDLVFVVGLDTCFGGESELARLAAYGLTPGVYSLDLKTGEYTKLLTPVMDSPEVHCDLYVSDLKDDGYPDLVAYYTPWNETVLRLGGGGSLYFVDNEEGVLSIVSVLSGDDAPSAVWVSENTDGHGGPVVYVGYYTRIEAGGRIFGSVSAIAYGENVKLAYITSDKLTADEGESFTLTVHNPRGRAGEVILTVSGQNAAEGREYAPGSFTVVFSEGEYSKQLTLETLFNRLPNGDMRLTVTAISEELNFDGSLTLYINDTSVIQSEVAYTILGAFASDYASPDFITGDEALFSVYPLMIDNLRSIQSGTYDIRFSVLFGGHVWSDSDGDGLISVGGLSALCTGSCDTVYMRVEFFKKGTDNVICAKNFETSYRKYREEESGVSAEDAQFTEILYTGDAANIYVRQSVTVQGYTVYGRFKLEYRTTADNRAYTFYSDANGVVDAQINFGSVTGSFKYRYTITSLTAAEAPVIDSGELDLYIAAQKMSYAVSVIDSVRQSLLRNALVEVVGLNSDYHFIGRTDAETGALILENIKPLKTYRITVNSDYGVSYFEKANYSFVPSVESPTLSLELGLRDTELSLDLVTVAVIEKQSRENVLPFMVGYSNTSNLYNYLCGRNVSLSSNDQYCLEAFYNIIACGAYRGVTGVTYYQIEKNVLFSETNPYKNMVKNPDDLVVVFYRENPNADSGTVKIKVSGTELTSSNSRYSAAIIDRQIIMKPTDPRSYCSVSYGPHAMTFYSFSGNENCLIDMEIISDMYLSGKKALQLASFGTGLGAFLLQPVQEIFSSLETAETPSGIPFLNNMSFGLGFGAVDFAFEFDEENMTFSLYMGASKDLYEKSRGMDYDQVDRPTLQQLYNYRAAGLSMGRGKGSLGIGLGGKMLFAYQNGEWRLVHGEIYFSVTASYNYTKYFVLPIVSIPAFFSATFTLEVSTTIYFDWDAIEEDMVVTGDLAIALSVEIECGIGIKGFLSASIYGQAGVEVIIQMESGGTKLTLWVQGGVRIQIIFWKYEYSFGRAEWSTQSEDYLERQNVFQTTRLSAFKAENDYSGVAMLYNAAGDLTSAYGLNNECRASDILVQNIYDKSAPQIAVLEDGSRMIAWINYDETRGVNNAEVISYTYFDGASWSDIGIADDTITADLDLSLIVVEGKFVIVCTEVKEALNDEAGLSERLKKSDVALLVFDADTRTFAKTILTDNLFNDRQALIDSSDGNAIIVVYRSENPDITDDMTTNDFLCGENANNKLYYTVYNTQTHAFGELTAFAYSLKAVVSMDVKIVSGIAYVVLEIDNDDNFDTVADRELVLLQYIFATGATRMTRLTDNDVQDVAPSLVEFQGEALIVFRSGDELKYWYGGSFYTLCSLPDTYTGFKLFSDGSRVVLLYAMPVNGVSQIFACVMDGETLQFSKPSQVTFSQKPARDPFLAFAENVVSLYYCADTYILLSENGDEEYSFKVESDIMATSFDFYGELNIEVLEADYSSMIPGREFSFTVRVYNTGTVNVTGAVLTARLGENELASVTAGVILGNDYLDIEISVVLPSERAALTFEIRKEGLDEDESDNTAETEILLTDVGFDKNYSVVRNEDGTVSVTVRVRNISAVDADIIVILTSYSDGENVFDSQRLSLPAGESAVIELTVQKSAVLFNSKNEFWMKAYLLTEGKDIYTVSEDDYDSANNVKSMKLSRVMFEDGTTLAVLTGDLTITNGGTGYAGFIYTGDGEISVVSSDTSVLAVNGRTLTAKKGGTVTITVTDGTVSKSFAVNVQSVLYTLSFVDADGTTLLFTSLEAGELVSAPDVQRKTGYTFGGWNAAVAATMPAANIIYTARWILDAPVIAAAQGYAGKYDKSAHTISVTASHPLGEVTYQWYKGSISEENLLEGQTGATLSVKETEDSGDYFCRISYTDGTDTVYADTEAITVQITSSDGTDWLMITGIAAGSAVLFTISACFAINLIRKKKRSKQD